MVATPKELAAVRLTAGLRSGYHTPKAIKAIWGLDVGTWPALFRVTRTGLVCKLDRHEAIYRAHLDQHRHNLNALGIR